MKPGAEGPAVAAGIIVFFALILAELAVTRWRRRPVHRLRNSISNLACGAVHGLANAYFAAALSGGYEAFRARFALFDGALERMSWVHYLLLVLSLDFLYYWNHRLLHRNKYMWCAHVVHHQSTDYNFTVSLRVSVLQVWYTSIFALPLALAGFPVAAVWSVFIADKFYQFWVHTQLIGSLGPLEWLLVTPRHHSVHHATNPEYIDRNFGGVFILWDRLFGTFAQRRAEPIFGITELLPTFSPILANVEPWQRLWRRARGRPETVGAVAPDARPWPARGPRHEAHEAHEAQDGARSAASVSSVATGLRLLAPVTVLLAFLFTQAAFSLQWVVATSVAMVWLLQLGRFLDGERTPGRMRPMGLAVDVAAVGFGAGAAVIALWAGWIRLPLALGIGAGCVMLTLELLVGPLMALVPLAGGPAPAGRELSRRRPRRFPWAVLRYR